MKFETTIVKHKRVEVDITPKQLIDLLEQELVNRLNAALAKLRLPELEHKLPADGYSIRVVDGGNEEILRGYEGRAPRDCEFIVKWETAKWIRRFKLIEQLRKELK